MVKTTKTYPVTVITDVGIAKVIKKYIEEEGLNAFNSITYPREITVFRFIKKKDADKLKKRFEKVNTSLLKEIKLAEKP